VKTSFAISRATAVTAKTVQELVGETRVRVRAPCSARQRYGSGQWEQCGRVGNAFAARRYTRSTRTLRGVNGSLCGGGCGQNSEDEACSIRRELSADHPITQKVPPRVVLLSTASTSTPHPRKFPDFFEVQ
jgi:hypothetical protein